MKKFLNESDKKKIISEKEKMIIESFAKTFNKIKRIDENEIKQNDHEDWELEDRKEKYDINPEITPSELYGDEISENEGTLSPEEQKILNDILNESDMLNEGIFDSVIEKVKSYAQKGMMTVGILTALLATPNLSNAQQSQIKQAAGTEMTTQKHSVGTDISKMSNAEVAKLVNDLCLKNPDKAKALAHGRFKNNDMLFMFADAAHFKNKISSNNFEYFGGRLKAKGNFDSTQSFINIMSSNGAVIGGFGI